MIEVVGHHGSSEYEAACSIRDALLELWPDIESSPPARDHVVISAGVKLSGYRVSDFDIVVGGVFHGGRSFLPTKVLKDRHGKHHRREPVTVDNFIAVLEVKDQDQRNIQIVGDSVDVYYSRGASTGWHSATEQNDKQLHALRFYLKDKGIEDAWVFRSLVMRGLPAIDIPGALPRAFSGAEFLTSLASLVRVDKGLDGLSFGSGEGFMVGRVLALPIFRPFVPTGLDRKRMDRILLESPKAKELPDLLGNKMVRLRGLGGTGKTIMLLQAARQAYSERGCRSLVLTYNRALASDIRRSLALMGIHSNSMDGGIAVQTVMSFMYSWFRRLQLLEEEQRDSYQDYPMHCRAATEMLEAGAIREDDLLAVKLSDPEKFDFDYIIVDESQDWPQAEADLLKALYPPYQIAMGDGVDQLLRGERTDWDKGVPEVQRHVIPLSKCLRMKSNLATFARDVSREVGLSWTPEPSDKGGGGHIYVGKDSISSQTGLLRTLTEAAKSAGNAEIDFLICVPPSAVSAKDGERVSDLAQALLAQGLEVWDGVDPLLRKGYPESKHQYRVVQYESCRGLEGWVVVLDRLDEAWAHYYDKRLSEGLSVAEREAFLEIGDVAVAHAWQRLMISLCRPIDSLVITLADTGNPCSELIAKLAREHSEFVTIMS